MSFTTRPELRGTFGMVASTHWLASAAGMSVLERGGNAYDAAVATRDPRWMTNPSQRTSPVSAVIGRTKFVFTSSVV